MQATLNPSPEHRQDLLQSLPGFLFAARGSLSDLGTASRHAPSYPAILNSGAIFAETGSGLVLLDGIGQICALNLDANTMLQQRDGLLVKAGELVCAKAPDSRRLRSIVADCLNKTTGAVLNTVGAMAASRQSGKPHIVIQVMPIVPNPGCRPAGQPALLVILNDPVAPIAMPPSRLAAIYGFSQRETDLALQLLTGATLREAATAAKMSYNTARVHLRSLFAKSGTKKQHQLIGVLRAVVSVSTG